MKLQYHCSVIGVTQSGKTTSSMKLLKSQSTSSIKIFINTKNEQKWYKTGDYYIRNATSEDVRNIYKNYQHFKGKIIILGLSRKSRKKEFIKIADTIMSIHERMFGIKTFLVIDEYHNFQSSRSLPKPLEELAVQGLGMGVTCVFISQRAAQINPSVRFNSETFIIHKQFPQDIENLYNMGIIPTKEIEFRTHHSAYLIPNARMGMVKLQ